MKLSEVMKNYNFETLKECLRHFYMGCLSESNKVANPSLAYRKQLETVQTVIESESLLDKATTLYAMREIKILLAAFCKEVNSNQFQNKPYYQVVAFYQPIEFDDSFLGLSTEEFRKMLFEAFGLEFTPFDDLEKAVMEYNLACKRLHTLEYSDETFLKSREAKHNLDILAQKSLISYELDFSSTFFSLVGNLTYSFLGLGFDANCAIAENVLFYPEEALPMRKNAMGEIKNRKSACL